MNLEITMINDIQQFYFDHVFNNSLFYLYLATIFIDVLTGNLVALKLAQWNSKTGLNGTLRHLGILSVVILLLPMISFTTQLTTLADIVLFYILAQYTVSILENVSALGMDLFDVFGDYFKFLGKGKEEKKQDFK